jgi:8-oxo-dGTP pyrophosphatase MutT (NUDIX family)
LIEQSEEAFVRAAGGLVWRDTIDGEQLLVIHRPRYDDWSLPKGKLEPGETWPEAARREVAEETGYSVTFEEFAGVTTYYHGRWPKVVLFWNMRVTGETGARPLTSAALPEVDEILWLDAAQAAEQLTYPAEQALVTENLARQRK